MDSSMGLQFGLVQYLGRMSGDSPAAVMLLTALLMPLFQNSLRILQWLLQKISAHFGGVRADTARRVIEFTDGENMSVQAPGPFQEEAPTERNNILQKAIRLYINRGKPQINDAELYLLSTPRGARSDDHRHPSLRPPRKAGDMDRALEKLMGYHVVRGPREDRWLLVDPERAVHFKFYSSTSRSCDEEDCGKGGGKGKGGGTQGGIRTTTTFELKATGRGAEQRLDAFVEEALQHYKDLRASAIDRSRYFIMPTFPTTSKSPHDDEYDYMKGCGKGRPGATPCKRYLLSGHKTFGSLFFSQKPQVISMLDDFMGGRGKFAIDGFPNKLGLLLHGPPGTGKTSLIKSIASYTKRHIVEVPLSKVTTNKVLFDTMFDLVFAVTGEDEALRMNFNDIVFVMEDVDAASDVVYARSPQEGKTSEVPAVPVGSPSGHSADLGAGPRGSGKGSGGEEVEHKDDEDEDAEDEEESLGKGFGKGFGKGKWGVPPAAKAGKGKEQENPDKLNLAGLLNVLDGVVDSPGRILIMTTNHPERLDPALIRPGRINFAVELGYLKAGPLCDLIQHVMAQEMTAAQRKLAAALVEQQELTPAQVEQTCAEVSSVEELLERLSCR